MQEDRIRTPQEQDDASDRAVMDMLLDHPGPWAVVDLQRELKAPLAAVDAVSRLAGAGMVHRIGDEFVFASRTAARAAAIFEG